MIAVAYVTTWGDRPKDIQGRSRYRALALPPRFINIIKAKRLDCVASEYQRDGGRSIKSTRSGACVIDGWRCHK